MPIDRDFIVSLPAETMTIRYEERDCILYALGVGFGQDPLDPSELRFVFEGNGLAVAPAFADGLPLGLSLIKKSGLDFAKIVHAEQRSEYYTPLPQSGALQITTRVHDLIDKGASTGALLTLTSDLVLGGGTRCASIFSSILGRADGGFGHQPKQKQRSVPVPERDPDYTVASDTRRDQALLYRLCGDRNPLHADPTIAINAGFTRPILHGLCTYGFVCRQVLQHFCDYDVQQLKSLAARFSAPIFPGETLVTRFWRSGRDLSFRSHVKDRNDVVLSNGHVVLA